MAGSQKIGTRRIVHSAYGIYTSTYWVPFIAEPSSGSPVTNTWTSTAKSTSSLGSSKDKTQESVKSKVAFDEMGDGKEKQNVPEKELKMNANKTAMAGDTQESSQVLFH